MAIYKVRRQARYDNLKSWGFIPFEARELSKIVDRSAKYFRTMLLDRKEIVEGLLREGEYARWSKVRTRQEIIDYLRYVYRDNHWEFSRSGVWEMYRDYRDRAISLGEYYPRRRKKKWYDFSGSRIDRGNLKLQRQKYKEKMKKSGN